MTLLFILLVLISPRVCEDPPLMTLSVSFFLLLHSYIFVIFTLFSFLLLFYSSFFLLRVTSSRSYLSLSFSSSSFSFFSSAESALLHKLLSSNSHRTWVTHKLTFKLSNRKLCKLLYYFFSALEFVWLHWRQRPRTTSNDWNSITPKETKKNGSRGTGGS